MKMSRLYGIYQNGPSFTLSKKMENQYRVECSTVVGDYQCGLSMLLTSSLGCPRRSSRIKKSIKLSCSSTQSLLMALPVGVPPVVSALFLSPPLFSTLPVLTSLLWALETLPVGNTSFLWPAKQLQFPRLVSSTLSLFSPKNMSFLTSVIAVR